ncbi:hypothetical protein JCM33374_g4592 [Metschnikowia sp. JCM 33374]|nr:hypothetical protein JCM33374_g4592 [Metschnikowia sp. JCM 33374]
MSFPQPTPERHAELIENYDAILNQVKSTSASSPVRLVAVSKLKPSSDIMGLYNHGVRHFGENYVQELVAKAKELPKDIKWHFIGGLQSGKCKDLGRDIDNLYAVETIDALKKCKKLDSARADSGLPAINVYLQVNTSAEEQKSGYTMNNLDEVYETVEFLKDCKTLKLQGLMTIGSFAESTSEDGVNQDFAALAKLKQILDEKYSFDLQLSMGMSNDFTTAIRQGSTSVRVGSSIFGARPPRNGH